MRKLIFILFILFSLSAISQNSFYWSHNSATVEEICYDYGYMYNSFVMINPDITSSDNWIVPSESDWNILVNYLGGHAVAGGKLKEDGYVHWYAPNTGATNEVGFNGRGTGLRYYLGDFSGRNGFGWHWTTTESSSTDFFTYYITARLIYDTNEITVSSLNGGRGNSGMSIRLVNPNTNLTNGQTGTYTGNDGVIYPTVCIGTQEWISIPLRERKLRGGEVIQLIEDHTAWNSDTIGARCAYNNQYDLIACGEVLPEEPIGGTVKYGYLYNWYAATDVRNITTSDDWRLPTSAESESFINATGGYTVAGAAIKEASLNYWDNITDVTNSSGFSSRGSGTRSTVGVFDDIRTYAYIATAYDFSSFWRVFRIDSYPNSIINYNAQKTNGVTIRLVSDATGIPDGTTTTYTGNDGRVYNAIAINGLYWTTENLAETEYRDGTPIPTVTDATEWSNLTTGAKCAYDNNEANVFE